MTVRSLIVNGMRIRPPPFGCALAKTLGSYVPTGKVSRMSPLASTVSEPRVGAPTMKSLAGNAAPDRTSRIVALLPWMAPLTRISRYTTGAPDSVAVEMAVPEPSTKPRKSNSGDSLMSMSSTKLPAETDGPVTYSKLNRWAPLCEAAGNTPV